MKKFYLLLFLFIFIFCLTSSSSKNILITSKTNSFYDLIKNYESFNEEYFLDYYLEYQKTNNIIYSLNKVNHPFFLDNNSIFKSFNFEGGIFVNKNYVLDELFVPQNLTNITVDHIKRENETMQVNKYLYIELEKLINDANKLSFNLTIFSAYRSFNKQSILYNNAADKTYVAKAGTSEHQTGLAIDIATRDTGLTSFFENTPEFLFLKDNAYKYGFILRYPSSKEQITKYPYECWHYRYVGKDIAKIMYNNDLCLEEYIYMYIELI